MGPTYREDLEDGEYLFGTSNVEQLYNFDADTGVLELSADSVYIEEIVKLFGGYPINDLVVNMSPIGDNHFHDVNHIKPLPRSDGSFFLQTS